MEYPKIETLFNRDADFKVVEGQLRRPEFGTIRDWVITEKIDGMNVRVLFSEYGAIEYFGRTDKSELPEPVLSYLKETFTSEKIAALWDPKLGHCGFILFGEAYGPKIQNGEKYRRSVAVRLFDILILDEGKVWWQEWPQIREIADKLGVQTVSQIPFSEVGVTVGVVKSGLESATAYQDSNNDHVQAEGVVARSNPLLFNRRGERVVWKLKTKDFRKERT